MSKLIVILCILCIVFIAMFFIEFYDKKQKKKTQNKLFDYRLQRIKINHIRCELCDKLLVDNDAVISFTDHENKLHTSHATCCFIIDEEKQILTDYDGEQVCKEDLPKYAVLICDDEKKKIEEFIK